jgi:hypothetical protein
MDYIKDKFDLSGIKSENQQVLAGLSEIGANGTVKFDLPGFDEQGKTLEDILKDGSRKTELDNALAAYQEKAGKSEKDLAIEQMTISDKQAKDINIIKETIMRNLSPAERKSLEDSIVKLTDATGEKSKKLANQGSKLTQDLPEEANVLTKTSVDNVPAMTTTQESALDTIIQAAKNTIFKAAPSGSSVNAYDLFVGAENSAPKVMSKGTIYKGIVGDEVAMGTNLSDAINKGSGGSGGGSGGGTVDGKIDININLTGMISGDKSGDIEKMFADPRIQKQLMDTVLYKLDNYKRQQGVLS